MIRLVVLAVGASLVWSEASAAEDPGLVRLKARAEACIRTNAADVERSDPSLNSAAEFLVRDLCAVEIGAHELYEVNLQMIANMRRSGDADGLAGDVASPSTDMAAKVKAAQARLRETYAKASIDPETGELVLPDGDMRYGDYMIAIDTGSPPHHFRALAARALLDARLARQARN